MLSISALQRLFLLLPLGFQNLGQTTNDAAINPDAEWTYYNTDIWGRDYPACDGSRQSPIYLSTASSFPIPLPPLEFINYDVQLEAPLNVTNNGHTVDIELTPTINGNRAYITGANLVGNYEAIGLHFHWGTRRSPGSEHIIDGTQYDLEMHIVHKNYIYETIEEARDNTDGIVVLGVMLEKATSANNLYPAIYKILNKVPQLVQYESQATISFGFALNNVLGDLDRTEYFTYLGSLTTPPCSEAVTWFVFPDALPIRASALGPIYNLINEVNRTLLNNFRPLQDLNGRKVFYRFNKDGFKPSFPFFN